MFKHTPYLFCCVNHVFLKLTSWYLNEKSGEVCIKARSSAASLYSWPGNHLFGASQNADPLTCRSTQGVSHPNSRRLRLSNFFRFKSDFVSSWRYCLLNTQLLIFFLLLFNKLKCFRFTDNGPPSFSNTCPNNMVFYTAECSSSALVSWNEPSATDNSGHVSISYPGIRPPVNLSIGLYNVMYSAVDSSGNRANCSFIVQVTSMPFFLP